MFELVHGEVFVDDLLHLERWLDVERDAGDDAQAAEIDDAAEETVAVFLTGEGDDLAICGHQFEGHDGGGEVAVAEARSRALPVAHAPTTEIWGSEARLCSA